MNETTTKGSRRREPAAPNPAAVPGPGKLFSSSVPSAREPGLSSPGAPTALAGDLRLAVATSAGRGRWRGLPPSPRCGVPEPSPASGAMLRPRERGQCSPRNRAGTEAPGSREGSGLGAEPPGFSRFLPSRSGPPPSLFSFYYYFFPFRAKQKFCPQSQAAGCGGFSPSLNQGELSLRSEDAPKGVRAGRRRTACSGRGPCGEARRVPSLFARSPLVHPQLG